MTRSRLSVLAAGLVLCLAGVARAGDIAGTWTTEFDSQVGPQKYTYKFKLEGEKLTGTAVAERMGRKDDVTLAGTLKDGKVSLVEPLNMQGQEITITYTGTLAGDEMKLTRKVGDFATEEIVVKRKQE
jgi:hypothetical protein